MIRSLAAVRDEYNTSSVVKHSRGNVCESNPKEERNVWLQYSI